MRINDLEINKQDNIGNNDNKALTVISLSDKEMSILTGGATPSSAPPTAPASEPGAPRRPKKGMNHVVK